MPLKVAPRSEKFEPIGRVIVWLAGSVSSDGIVDGEAGATDGLGGFIDREIEIDVGLMSCEQSEPLLFAPVIHWNS